MNHIISPSTARANLDQILKRVGDNNERFIIKYRGQPTAIIFSVQDALNTFAPIPNWLKKFQSTTKDPA